MTTPTPAQFLRVGVMAFTLLGILGSGAFWVDARYAKVTDIHALRSEVRCAAREIKISNLRMREQLLLQEEIRFEIARQERRLTALELSRYNQVLSEHGQLQALMRTLETAPGCD